MTAIAESFNTADSSTLGPDLTWTKIGSGASIVSNRCRFANGGGTVVRADTDLSGTDQSSEVKAFFSGTSANAGLGPLCRKDSSSTLTFYLFWITWSTTYLATMYKVVNGTFTGLGTTSVPVTFSSGDTLKLTVNGTTLTGYINGTEIMSRTDSAITTGLRTGARGYDSASQAPEIDDFAAADLSAAATSFIYFQPAIAPLLVR